MWNIWLLMCPNLLCFDWSMGCIDLIGSIYDVRALIVLIMGGLGFWSLIRLRTNSNTNCYRFVSCPDKTVPDKTVPDKTVPNCKIFPDKTVPDKIVPRNQTKQSQTK